MLPQQLLMGEELELVSMLEGAPGRGVHGGPQRGRPVHQLRWGMSRDAVREAGGWGWLEDSGLLRASVYPSPQGVGDAKHQAMQKCNQKCRGEMELSSPQQPRLHHPIVLGPSDLLCSLGTLSLTVPD